MRQYVVRAGDTPASIAAKPDMAGCPKCAIDLIRANPHKRVSTFPNGFTTFTELVEGETLSIPEKWSSAEFDARPSMYFAALPHFDGVTSSTLGARAIGVLGDYMTFETAIAAIEALRRADNREFSLALDTAVGLIDRAVAEARTGTDAVAAGYAQDARAGLSHVARRGIELAAALEAGDMAAVNATRAEIQNVLASSIDSAQRALTALYTAPPRTPPLPLPPPPRLPAKPPFPPVLPPSPPVAVAPAEKKGTRSGAAFGYTALGVAVVGGAIYSALHPDRVRRFFSREEG